MVIDPISITESEARKQTFPLEKAGMEKRPGGFCVLVPRSVLNSVRKFGKASMEAEVGGMLLGELFWDEGPYLQIDDLIEGKYTDEKSASVTFTAETWDYVHSEMERLHTGKKILGWYHTHPGFGIFLSHMDLFIHENFFSEPWQIAYVYDPHADEDGFFTWQNGELVKTEPIVIKDTEMPENSARKIPQAPTELPTQKIRPSSKPSPLHTFLLILILILQVLILLGIGFVASEKLQQYFPGEYEPEIRQDAPSAFL